VYIRAVSNTIFIPCRFAKATAAKLTSGVSRYIFSPAAFPARELSELLHAKAVKLPAALTLY